MSDLINYLPTSCSGPDLAKSRLIDYLLTVDYPFHPDEIRHIELKFGIKFKQFEPYLHNPRSLRHLARASIRRCCRHNVHHTLHNLPHVPNSLKEYITIPEPLHWCNLFIIMTHTLVDLFLSLIVVTTRDSFEGCSILKGRVSFLPTNSVKYLNMSKIGGLFYMLHWKLGGYLTSPLKKQDLFYIGWAQKGRSFVHHLPIHLFYWSTPWLISIWILHFLFCLIRPNIFQGYCLGGCK